MSIISQTKAEQIAKELLAKKAKNVAALKTAFQKLVYDEYMKTIPLDVRKFLLKHKEYTNTNSSLRLIGNGFDHLHVTMPSSVPISQYSSYQPDSKTATKLVAAHNAHEKAEKEHRNAVSTVTATLVSLKSFAKIREHFPEAAPFLPEPTKTELVNISEVRKLVK